MRILIALLVCVISVQGQSGNDTGKVASLGKVTCQPDTMTVVFKKADLEGNKPQIGDEDCKAEIKEDNDTYTVIVPLDGCDTDSRVDDKKNKIAYMNKIILSGESESVITRIDNKIFPFGCVYDTTGTAKTRSFAVLKRNVTAYEQEYGKFNFIMDFYKSDKFEEAYEDSSYPINVKLSEKIYTKVSVGNAGKRLSIFIKECAATPSMDPDHETKYVLIENGCHKDATLEDQGSTSTSKSFSFKSFRFTKFQDLDAIYVHCKVKVCHEDSEDSICKDGCKKDNGGRRRRALRDEGSSPGNVGAGPLMINAAVESGVSSTPHSHTTLIVGCAVGAAALVALAIIGAVIYTKRLS